MDDLQTCCNVGVMSADHRLSPGHESQTDGSEHEETYSFPHKLFQEYVAGTYFASLCNDAPLMFQSLLTDRLIPNYEEFKYLLYFTGAHGKRFKGAGRMLINTLCTKVKNEMFIADVAFECQDEDAFHPAMDFFTNKSLMELIWSSHQKVEHTWSGFEYTLAAVGRRQVG